MGGRRSRPIYQIIQKTPEAAKKISDLSKSIEKLDIESIATKSGSLFSNAFDFADSFIHTQKLFEEIKKKYKPKIKIRIKKLEQITRKEWSLYKKKNNIQLSKAAEYNIIHAISKALKEGKYK